MKIVLKRKNKIKILKLHLKIINSLWYKFKLKKYKKKQTRNANMKNQTLIESMFDCIAKLYTCIH